MTRLTQYLMDLGKININPMKKKSSVNNQLFPFKTAGPAGIKDKLSGRNERQRASPCTQEMSHMLICFKKVGFNDERCAKEIEAFQNCSTNYKKLKESEAVSGGKHSRETVVSVLKKFPQKK